MALLVINISMSFMIPFVFHTETISTADISHSLWLYQIEKSVERMMW